MLGFEKGKDWSPLAIRIIAGIIFIFAGFGKLSDIAGTTGMFDGLGIPAAGLAVWVVALVELLGGIALLVGLWSRWVAIPLGITMIVAAITQLPNGFMMAWAPLFALAGLISLMFSGSGKLSVDAMLLN